MHAYYFTNMYLSSIQQGVQPLHVTSRMFVKYQRTPQRIASNQYKLLMDWAENYEIVTLLNAGYSSNILEIMKFFDSKDNYYPWNFFNEGENALDGALTSIGIVVPERIHKTAKVCRENRKSIDQVLLEPNFFGQVFDIPLDLTDFEKELITKINKFPLAR